ncbi:DUF7010 family protein [Psychrosphaera algicola]|uniref:Uncharacterized protein n=1 Tax=Psychrosphaera algicola TaxID=3023714 RepID=A0ABT5F845_9GAMM|nr:hypothetical protein [Psychrosphaera sp. G1-22]MDC2887714.1 hypothetical protein [Psychrosphaera sp. G1-22]
MNFNDAQNDMDIAYFGGATGVLVSGIVWCIAASVALFSTDKNSMLTLFFGGMVIFPLSIVLAKLLQRSGAHHSNNPLSKLAMETTVILFVGLFIAFTIAQNQATWFYPIMLLAIGVRYLMFQTLYGNKLYWVLGAALMLAGALCIVFNAAFITGAFVGGIIEVLFSFALFYNAKNPISKN